MVEKQQNDANFWCTCGRHWKAPVLETQEIDHSEEKLVVEVPDIPKPIKTIPRGRNTNLTAYSFDNRCDYLRRNNLIEIDILQDDEGKEYFIRDNFNAGTTQKIYLPERFKRKKK